MVIDKEQLREEDGHLLGDLVIKTRTGHIVRICEWDGETGVHVEIHREVRTHDDETGEPLEEGPLHWEEDPSQCDAHVHLEKGDVVDFS